MISDKYIRGTIVAVGVKEGVLVGKGVGVRVGVMVGVGVWEGLGVQVNVGVGMGVGEFESPLAQSV